MRPNAHNPAVHLPHRPSRHRPVVAITTDLVDRNARQTASCAMDYAHAVWRAGGMPVLLSPVPESARAAASATGFDAFVFTGGDDPTTEPFGQPTHPQITPVLEPRQRFETDLLKHLRDERPQAPVLAVCLGMQMMALTRGGSLHQFMPESHPTHDEHWARDHPVRSVAPASAGGLDDGIVHSRHKQAVDHPGSLRVLARSPDGVIEAVHDPAVPFFLGVQWHPERTTSQALGIGLFERLVQAARVEGNTQTQAQ